MGVKVTGQFEPAGDFSIVDGKDVSGNITGSNISSSGQIEAASIGTNLASIISGSTPFGASDVSGSWRGELSSSAMTVVGGGVSGSSTSTGSFGIVESGKLNISGEISGSNTKVAGTLTVNDDIVVGEYIKHKGDVNTRIYFTDDRIRFQAGGIDFMGMHNKSSTPHLVTINNGSNNIDFQVKDNSNNTLIRTDADEQLVKFPDALQVSGSSVSTASFGTIQTTTGTIPTLIGNTTFRDNLTVTGNLDVSDTIYHTGDSNTKIRFPEVDTIAFNTSGLERLRITSDGQISGSAVSTGSFGQLVIGNGGDIELSEDQRIYFESDKGTFIEANMSDSLRVVAGGSQMFVLDYDTGNRAVFGNGTKVYIGADNTKLPDKELVVDGDISGSSTSTGSFGSLSLAGKVQSNLRMAGTNLLYIGDDNTYIQDAGSYVKLRIADGHYFAIHNDSGDTERFRINDNGRVGIGQNNPGYLLDVLYAGDEQFRVGRSSTKYVAIRDDVIRYYGMQGNGMRIVTDNNASMKHGIGTGDFLVDNSTSNANPRLNVSCPPCLPRTSASLGIPNSSLKSSST